MMLLSAEQVSACARYVIEASKDVIESFGPRPPGSEAERKTQERVCETLKGCCDEAPIMEPFMVAPYAFLGGQQIVPSVLVLVGTGVYWWYPWVSAIMSALAVAVMFQELFRYKRFLDPFFPKKTSWNVYGARKPTGEVKRRFVLNGHPDATHEWLIHYHWPKLFGILVRLSLLGMLVKFGTDVLAVMMGDVWILREVCGGIQLVLAPFALVGLFFTSRRVVPGANDNLSGTFCALGVMKSLHEAGVALEHTELAVMIGGSEEAGLRGAKAWCESHAGDYEDVETIFIVLDTMAEIEHLKVYNRDLNGQVLLDKQVCALLQNAMNTCGFVRPYGSVLLGSSDAAAFTQGGLRAGALIAMDPTPARYYHTRLDHWSIMSPDALEATVQVLLTALEVYDRDGLPDE